MVNKLRALLVIIPFLIYSSMAAATNKQLSPACQAWEEYFPLIQVVIDNKSRMYRFNGYFGELNLDGVMGKRNNNYKEKYCDPEWLPLMKKLYEIWYDAITEETFDRGQINFDPAIISNMDFEIITYIQDKIENAGWDKNTIQKLMGSESTNTMVTHLKSYPPIESAESICADLLARLVLNKGK